MHLSILCFQVFEQNSRLGGGRIARAPAPCDVRVLGAVWVLSSVGRRPADCREWLLLVPTVGHSVPTVGQKTTEADLASPGSSSGRELLPAQLPEETIVGQNIL